MPRRRTKLIISAEVSYTYSKTPVMRYRIKTEGGPSEGSTALTFVSHLKLPPPPPVSCEPLSPSPKSPIYASAKEDILQQDHGVQSLGEKISDLEGGWAGASRAAIKPKCQR